MPIFFTVFLVVLGGLLAFWVLAYNSLVSLRQRVKEALSDIQVQTKRRYDLIPNLVETVKGYAAHEAGIFEKVSEARARAMGAKGMKEQAEAENALSSTLKSLFAVAEAYPQLQASENFLELQRELTDTEDKIQAARRFYNANARDLNIAIETFPANMIAGYLGFKAVEFFEAGEETKEPVKVKF